MKTIAFVVPYFGKLPDGFQIWLNSCKKNSTIDWILFTDDKSEYNYPENVKRIFTTFENLKERIQLLYDFQISLNKPWKLCDFKVAYGEIFEKELSTYDFWGFCDIDLIWGDIRKFYTEELLDSYDKIGFQGHATIIKNTKENNGIYRKEYEDCDSYRNVFSKDEGFCFDEWTCSKIFKKSGKKVYEKVNFANLQKYSSNFFLLQKPNSESYKNKYQIFLWENGKINRYYLKENEICMEEYMYLHFWCRPITYRVKNIECDKLVIYPDIVTDKNYQINVKTIKHLGKKRRVKFLMKILWKSRKKITLKKILKNIKSMMELNKYIKNH